ncbi:hypothetical protein [uncultured Shimia sp.]|uniref:hypothetical protein n=1 Tax=uncultured Shimia sp. TaxID=573152 RepID=UPI00262C670E|nr:hypothetical protein [uncultured Shimia sp.]
MKTVSIYAAPLLVAGLITLAQMFGLTWADAGLAVFTFLLHAPSLVPVRTIRQSVGAKLGAFPETPFFAFIFLAWGAAAILYGSAAYALTAGAVFSVSVGIQFGVVRAIDLIVKKVRTVGAHNPNFQANRLMNLLKRITFVMRAATAGLSFLVLWSFMAGGEGAIWWLPIAVLAPILSVLATYGNGQNLLAFAKQAAETADETIAAACADNPPTCAIYYSSAKSSRHHQLAPTIARLKEAGVVTALMSREQHSTDACRAANPDHLWRAYTLDTLDTFAQPSVKAALYLNDAAKNTHFIRFNEMAHILVAQDAPLSSLRRLRSNMAVYDAIVAPDAQVAALWRRSSDPEVASRVVVVDPNAVPLPELAPDKATYSTLALCLEPGSMPAQDMYHSVEVLRSIVRWVEADPARRLMVSCQADPDVEETPVEVDAAYLALRQVLKAEAETSEQVTVLEGAETLVRSTGDILIGTGTDDLWSYAQSKRPLLLLGPWSERTDGRQLWGIQEDVFAQLDAATKGAHVPAPETFKRQRFNSLATLIEGVSETKQTGV